VCQRPAVYRTRPATDFLDDRARPDNVVLPGCPKKTDAIVLEVPKEDTGDWVAKAANAGIKDVWIHMGRETPEAVALAQDNGMNARTGTCAVMYVTPGLSYHSIHKWIMKRIGKY
jgi:predicted CoA-binding protein